MYKLHKLCESTLDHNENFWHSIKLIVTKPHIVNKRLTGSVPIKLFECNGQPTSDNAHHLDIIYTVQSSPYTDDETILQKLLNLALRKINANFEEAWNQLICSKTPKSATNVCLVIVNKLLPKNLKIHCPSYELCIIDPRRCTATFVCFDRDTNRSANKLPYTLQLFDDNQIVLHGYGIELESLASTVNWLKTIFFKKFLKWCNEEVTLNNESLPPSVQSLSHVDIEAYNYLYNHLKEKYGTSMVEIWPERTDPKKFVYEDIAIAAYLLVLWKTEREHLKSQQLQSFVDLGCGNGLLVYILSSEGHSGYGIDLRARGIWTMYPETTILKTEAITPSDRSLFPHTDWIIGNHSDELSPWIPVIAARSSPATRFFLLPCCAYEFDGTKYQRRACHHSQYQDFLEYVQQICNCCGFSTFVDRLKIPSTKRICIVGYERATPADSQRIQTFIDGQSKKTDSVQATAHPDNTTAVWSEQFRPRSIVERVQNCTKIDKAIEREIVRLVFDRLIVKKRYVADFEHPRWNVGGQLSLGDVAAAIPNDKLRELKSECGGLQTLLRNNNQIFAVQQGTVQLRLPIKYSVRLEQARAANKEFTFKEKPCWFRANHPDGCPFSDDDCSFKH